MTEGGSKTKSKLYHERARMESELRVINKALAAKRAHDKERKEARSARRATGHSRRDRNREKMKMPALDGGDSSITYYTSDTATMEGTSPSESDSIPEIDLTREE